MPALDLAFALATRPGFDSLFDPNPATGLIEPYHDDVGFPTQGYGRLLSRVKWEDLSKYPATEEAFERAWCRAKLAKCIETVRKLCPVPLTDSQTAALADFVYNCGGGNLQISALRQAVIRGDHERVPDQFMRWTKAGGRELKGLVRRRKAEVALYLS